MRIHAGTILSSMVLLGLLQQANPTDVLVDSPIAVLGAKEQGLFLDYGFIDFAALGADSLVVSDARTPAVYIVSLDGRSFRQIGRQGMGPGEYLDPRTIQTDDREIIFEDRRLNRLTIYSREGEYLDTVPIEGSPRSFVVVDDWIVVGTLSPQGIVQMISRNDPSVRRIVVSRESDVFNGRTFQGLSTELATDGSRIYCLILEENLIVSFDVKDPDKSLRLVQPRGPTIEQKKIEYENTSKTYTGRMLFMAFNRYLSVLPSGHLLAETMIRDPESYTGRMARGVILDPTTGEELDVRLRPSVVSSWLMRSLPGGRLAWADLEEMKIRLYNLPVEVKDLVPITKPDAIADVRGPRQSQSTVILVVVAILICILIVSLCRWRKYSK